jgi:SAM-dependent methyltransferase
MLCDPVVAQDVDALYRLLLGRAPEAGIVDRIVATRRPVAEILASILDCDEYFRRTVSLNDNASFYSSETNDIRLSSSPQEMLALEAHVRRIWSNFGRETPYWSVLTSEEYRRGLDPDKERQFYDTGARDVRTFLAACRRNNVRAPSEGAVVDFGCGVGRLGEHLSAHFAHYIGVDISAPHLEITRAHLAKLRRTNVLLSLTPDFLDSAEGFDCFFSLIVLQHNPPPIIGLILDRVLERLRPGGVAFFQVPTFLHGYRFDVADYLGSRQGEGELEMHAFPQSKVHELITKHGCQLVEMLADGMAGGIGRSHTFLVQKPI